VSRLKGVWSRIRSTKGLGRDVSIFAGIVVLGLGVAGYILANQRVIWPWDERVTYVAEFSEVPGVVAGQGQEVRIAGVAVGDIVGTEVSEEGRARLKLSLRKEHGTVYDNAQLVLRPKSPLNEMYILLDPGGPPGRKLESGDAIPGVRLARPIQIEEVLGHLDEDTREAMGVLLVEADRALVNPAGLSAGFKAADATMAALQPVAEALESRRDKIATLVSALGDIAAAVGEDDARLAGLVDSARATLATLARHDGDFDATLAQLPGFTDDLRAATGALAGLAGELNPTLDGLRKASGTLPPALAGLTDVVEKVGTTVAMARPVVDGAKPLVADLRPFVDDARAALDDLSVVTGRFDPITANVVKYLGHIADFAYNSNSMVSPEDANGPLLRGLVTVGRESDPSGQVAHSSKAGAR
jgi:phospholipid/cholesterol/gamma-HCH transport system substrate-binding protein